MGLLLACFEAQFLDPCVVERLRTVATTQGASNLSRGNGCGMDLVLMELVLHGVFAFLDRKFGS